MSTRDNASPKKLVQHLKPAVYTATQTPANGVDTKGFDSVMFEINVGDLTNPEASPPTGSWTFKAEESDEQASGFAAITDSARILVAGAASPVGAPNSSTGVFLTLDANGVQQKIYHVGVLTSKRYVRIVSTAASTPGNSSLAITAIMEHAAMVPVSN